MDIKKALDKMFLDHTLNELKIMNKNYPLGSLSYNSQLYLDIINYTKDCTITFLANKLQISKPAVTIKIKELMRKGLVTKTQCTEDRRVLYINLTGEVKELYREFDKKFDRFTNSLKSHYTQKEFEIFVEMLGHVSVIYIGDE